MTEETIENCKIAFEETEYTPGDTIIKKKALEVVGKSLKEVRKHFDEVWKNEK